MVTISIVFNISAWLQCSG